MDEHDYSGLHVLVVDDNDVTRRLFEHTLRKMGFTSIETAGDGLQADEKMKAKVYDIVFLDWNMPNKNGLEVLKEHRRNPAYDNTAIVMVTAQSDPKCLIEASKAGASLYIIKPFTPMHLMEKISYVVAGLFSKRNKNRLI